MACRRFSIASSRPGGVIGVSSGQAACRIETALAVASSRPLRSACCASVGLTASSIRSIGRLVRPGFCSLQLFASGTAAWLASALSFGVFGPIALKRSFCSSESEL